MCNECKNIEYIYEVFYDLSLNFIGRKTIQSLDKMIVNYF